MDAGQNPIGALYRAKLALRKNDPHFAKPFYWGPFQVYIASAAR
jgi:CHAT domain-containing protein